MKIVQLTADNVKRLRAVQVTPDGALVVVGGRNAQGKTSLLDSIQMALGGARAIPAHPVHQGEDSAEIVLELGEGEDRLIVTRKISADGRTSLAVTTPDGAKYDSPQALLDRLLGALSFDPLAFLDMKPKEQAETLRKVLGLDFTELDARRRGAFDKRTDHNREVSRLQTLLQGAPEYPDAPEDEISVSDVSAALEAANTQALQISEALAKAGQEEARATGLSTDAERQRAEAAALIADAEAKEREAADITTRVHNSRRELDDRREALPDREALRAQLATAEETNRKVRENLERKKISTELAEEEAAAASCTETIEGIDAEKQKTLQEAEFPVPGLSFTEDAVLFQGFDFSEASGAEQIRVSVAMGLAMNPKLRILLVRDGSRLDPDQLALVAKMAEEAEAQVWMERVSEGDEVTVVIEDGQVKDR